MLLSSPPVPTHMMSNGNYKEKKKKSSDSSDTASASNSTSDDGAFDDFLAFLSKPPADSPPIDIDRIGNMILILKSGKTEWIISISMHHLL